MTTHRYTIVYEVEARTPSLAVIKAGQLVRRGVNIVAVRDAEQFVDGWYRVTFEVEDPMSELEMRYAWGDR